MIKSMVSNIHSEDLAKSLEKREEILTTNEVILSSIYLDPRIRRILLKNPLQLAAAKNHLVGLMRQILALNKKDSQTIDIDTSPEASQATSTQPDDGLEITSQSTCSFLNAYLNSIEVASDCEESEEEDEPELKLDITEIYGYSPKPIDLNVDIMCYWEDKKFTYPRLYRLAKIVHSVPAMQVSVERAFSALKLVLTDSADSIKKIMFLKLNK
ncbi:uncharacterized protein LOC116804734 [Drosophila mojavensis]|uniref:uncharacterized protein LOC116804734 n=1 Tax=Drosophila mojavensis TaxID=7230 RepID=UPI001CD0F1EA|nr:uncharacterized protein LOC116804734 [Drosophila mojavensis]